MSATVSPLWYIISIYFQHIKVTSNLGILEVKAEHEVIEGSKGGTDVHVANKSGIFNPQLKNEQEQKNYPQNAFKIH